METTPLMLLEKAQYKLSTLKETKTVNKTFLESVQLIRQAVALLAEKMENHPAE